MIAAILPAILTLVGKAVDKAVPDTVQAEALKAQMAQTVLAQADTELRGAIDIIKAEAEGGSWLQRNWRPILMLTFAGLIVARWLGFSAPGLSEAEALKLWDIVQLGIGGYVVGRSVEKIAPSIADAIKGR